MARYGEPQRAGAIRFLGLFVASRLPHERAHSGVFSVPERFVLFKTVRARRGLLNRVCKYRADAARDGNTSRACTQIRGLNHSPGTICLPCCSVLKAC